MVSFFTVLKKEGKLVAFAGDGKSLASLTHVDNCVYGHLLAASRLKWAKLAPAGNAYHVHDGKEYNYSQYFKRIAVGMGAKEKDLGKFFIPAWVALWAGYLNEKLYEYFGWCIDPKKQGTQFTYMSMLHMVTTRTFSLEKAKRDLGYEPVVDPETAFKETLKWFQENCK